MAMATHTEWTESEDVYSGVVPVVLKSADRDDRTTALTIAIKHTTGQPRNQRVLHVQLTDESDAFLLYTLEISEDDFHVLKMDQNILVDFAAFPTNLIELLRECQSRPSDEASRFAAVLSTLSGAPVLTITETNQFRQLAHLALKFIAGNDAAIKRHLAGRVVDFKEQLQTTNIELAARLAKLHELDELSSSQAEQLRTISEERAREISELNVRHAGELAAAKEAAVSAQQEQASASEAERHRMLERTDGELREARRAEAEASARVSELTNRMQDLQIQIREVTSKLQGAEQEVTLLRSQTSALRDENTTMSSNGHRLEKALSAREVELAAATQAVKDKNETLVKTASLHEAACEAKRQLEDTITMHKESNSQLHEKLKLSSAEITKGNGIISRLQSDCRELKAKLKLKAAIIAQQQEQVQAKQADADAAERSIAEMRAEAAELRADKERAEEAATALRQQLAEAHGIMRENRSVIEYLNEELNKAPPTLGTSAYLSTPSRSSAASAVQAPSTASGLPFAPVLTPTGAKLATPTGASGVLELGAASSLLTSKPAPGGGGSKPAAAVTRLDFDVASPSKGTTPKPYVPGAALASLRSRAGQAMAAESVPSPDMSASATVAAITAVHSTVDSNDFSDYLNASTSYGGVPLGAA